MYNFIKKNKKLPTFIHKTNQYTTKLVKSRIIFLKKKKIIQAILAFETHIIIIQQ